MVTQTGVLEPQDVQRGVVVPGAAAMMRTKRVPEKWLRYDSIIVGIGASKLDAGFFESFADMGEADSLRWFSQRNSSVGPAYTNTRTERTDWAQDLLEFGVEFYAPPGFGDIEANSNDRQFWPTMWVMDFAARMSFEVTIAESDQMLLVPGNHVPAGVGVGNARLDGSAAPSVTPGTTGVPMLSNVWQFRPDPIMLPANGKISVQARIDQPLRPFLANYPDEPGNKVVPKTTGTATMANWFVIKCFFRGPRYLQFRGARSAS